MKIKAMKVATLTREMSAEKKAIYIKRFFFFVFVFVGRMSIKIVSKKRFFAVKMPKSSISSLSGLQLMH